jgi:hypothetical protein
MVEYAGVRWSLSSELLLAIRVPSDLFEERPGELEYLRDVGAPGASGPLAPEAWGAGGGSISANDIYASLELACSTIVLQYALNYLRQFSSPEDRLKFPLGWHSRSKEA